MQRVRLLPGRTALAWALIARPVIRFWVFPALGCLIILIGVEAVLGSALIPVVLTAAAVSLGGVLVALVLLGVVAQIKGERERRAGYTSFSDFHLNIAQIAPGTDVVIREANAPALSGAEFVVAVAKAKAAFSTSQTPSAESPRDAVEG